MSKLELYINGQKAGLYQICNWWLETYPKDVFVNEPKEVVEIRKLCEKILRIRK